MNFKNQEQFKLYALVKILPYESYMYIYSRVYRLSSCYLKLLISIDLLF